MNYQNMDFEEIKSKIKKALHPDTLDINFLNEIVNYIHVLDAKERQKYKELYFEIGIELFKLGSMLPQYKPNLFDKPTKSVKPIEIVNDFNSDKDFSEKLQSLLEHSQKDLSLLSRCFLLRFGNNKKLKYSFLLLHDFHSRPTLFNKVNTEFNDNCIINDIDEFIDKLKSNNLEKANYIVLLTLSSHMNPEDTVVKKLRIIRDYIDPIEQINILPKITDEHSWECLSDFSTIVEEIKFLVSKDLKDMDIDVHVEKILKKMFKHNDNYTLQYKKISVGYSGSMVLYIEPSGMYSSLPKYIVKVGNTPETRKKIEEENLNFKKYVQNCNAEYAIEDERTEHCTAIKYNYAAKYSKIGSKSFREKFNDIKIEHSELKGHIKQLFGIDLIKTWNSAKEFTEINFEDHYSKFVNLKKLNKTLSVIYCVELDKIDELELMKILNEIKEVKFQSYIKNCHGDLHTDNFFIDDEKNIFLIDFGDTGKWHALIDYATLECSIKFRHIPKYIENELLYKIEEELVSPNSFSLEFEHQTFTREDLIRPFNVIKHIRQQLVEDRLIKDKTSYLEYLYSLFMITVRQINYSNLNQLYAINSAIIIGKEILRLKRTN